MSFPNYLFYPTDNGEAIWGGVNEAPVISFKKKTKIFKGKYTCLIDSTYINFTSKYLSTTRLLCYNNILWDTDNFHPLMRLDFLGFNDVITMIKIDLTCDNRLHLVSIFYPWLVLICHSDSQETHM